VGAAIAFAFLTPGFAGSAMALERQPRSAIEKGAI
jgi:hypothetical protein